MLLLCSSFLFLLGGRNGRQLQQIGHLHQGYRLPPHRNSRLAFQTVYFFWPYKQGLDYGIRGYCLQPPLYFDQHYVNTGNTTGESDTENSASLGGDSRDILPFNFSTLFRSTSSPTPLPEISVTKVRVEKPGRKIRLRSCWGSFGPVVQQCRVCV